MPREELPDGLNQYRPQRRAALLEVLVVLGIIGVLIAALLPAQRPPGAPAAPARDLWPPYAVADSPALWLDYWAALSWPLLGALALAFVVTGVARRAKHLSDQREPRPQGD